MDPCGTPVLIGSLSDNLPINIVHWLLPVRYEGNQFMVFFEHLYSVIFELAIHVQSDQRPSSCPAE